MKNMKRLLMLILVFGLLLINGCGTKEDETVKIGAILALTGSIANQGEWVKNGLELAKDEINANGGIDGKNIQLIYEDAQADAKLALNSYQKLRQIDNVNTIITMGSGVGIALTEPVNNDKVIQMGVATASPAYSTPNDYTFRVFETADLEMKNLAYYMYTNFDAKKVAILWINNDYGKGVKDVFEKEFNALGGNIVFSESFDVGNSDFRTVLQKIKESNPDAVFMAPYTKEGGYILKQAKESGVSSSFFSSQAILGGQELFDIAGNSAEGLFIATPKFDLGSDNPTIVRFVEEYKKRYNSNPEIYGARAYDSLFVLKEAISSCTSDKDTVCIKDALFKIKDYDGVSGKIAFNENGDVMREFELKIVKNQTIVRYKD